MSHAGWVANISKYEQFLSCLLSFEVILLASYEASAKTVIDEEILNFSSHFLKIPSGQIIQQYLFWELIFKNWYCKDA